MRDEYKIKELNPRETPYAERANSRSNDILNDGVKPYIVKSHDIHLDNEYREWIQEIKKRYQFYSASDDAQKLQQLVGEIPQFRVFHTQQIAL